MLWSILKHLTGTAGTAAPAGDALDEGIRCMDRGDFSGARAHLQSALAASPDDTDGMYFLALAEARSGHLGRSRELLEAACARRDDAEIHNALGNVYRMSGCMEDAVQSYRRAIGTNAGHLAALANLGLALRDQGEPQQSLPVLDRALALAPDHVEALFNKALALIDLGERKAADDLIERVLGLDPDFAEAHLQRGFMLLKHGNFAQGWREYAWRTRIQEVDHWQEYAFPLWQGEALAGKRVLVQAEQGLGDQIMFASCLPDILSRAQHTVIECDPRLAGLFARSFPSAAVYRHRVQGEPDWSGEPVPDFRMRCGDLPRVLRNAPGDFPAHGGYLVPDAQQVEAWRARLDALGPGLKIGLSWRGGTPGTGQSMRSVQLNALLPILSVPAAHFISLQYGSVSAEIDDLRARRGITLHEWSDAHADMDGVAALIASLDLVITVCTTAAHLSGALGKPAWVLVPAVAEWRYLESGSAIPWYPALRLFRQAQTRGWSGVITAISAELQIRAAATGTT